MNKLLKNTVFGFLIGVSVIIPGLSGGTTALIIGIYSDIIRATDELFSNFKKNSIYLMTICCGAVLGFFLCSFPVKFILDRYFLEFSYFVIGVIVGGIPVFFTGVKKFEKKYILLILGGVVITLLTDLTASIKFAGSQNPITFVAVCLLSAIALILPGISLTYILMAFGYYQKLITALNSFDFLFILKFGTVTLLGIFAFTKILNCAYKKYPASINMMILGMVVASLKQIFVRLPVQGEIVHCVLLLISGIFVSMFFSLLKKSAD